jgi:hypothetical protein
MLAAQKTSGDDAAGLKVNDGFPVEAERFDCPYGPSPGRSYPGLRTWSWAREKQRCRPLGNIDVGVDAGATLSDRKSGQGSPIYR